MHTGAQLTGAVCKCMDCARQRQDALRHEARIRYRDEFNLIVWSRDNALLAQQEAVRQLELANDRMNDLINRVREEVV